MNWADPTIYTKATAGTLAGSMKYFNISGTQVGLRQGRGITTEFLDKYLTDGKPINKAETVFSNFRLNTVNFNYKETLKYNDLKVAYFQPEVQTSFTPLEVEERQMSGELPYPNQKCVTYARGVPVIIGFPNFYKVNETIYRLTRTTLENISRD
jgi:hypothetical protein